MKKLFQLLLFIAIVAAGVWTYNYFTNYSLFDPADINAPAYQEETVTSESANTDQAQFELLYYSQLDAEKKKIYDKIYFAIKEHNETNRIHSDLDSDEIFDIVGYVLGENPQLFWSNGACTYDQMGNLTFEYIYDRQQSEDYTAQIEYNTREIIASAKKIEDEFERSLLLFDYIASNTEYDSEAVSDLNNNPDVSTIVGVFINQKAVCGGYAKAYQYLLGQCGLGAETVYGTAKLSDGNIENHAWTLQFVNGNYYYSDVTWGDSLEDQTDGYISHIYFCLTEDEMALTHTLDSSVIYPECISTADNYFVRRGLYFESYSSSDIRQAISEQLDGENVFIELKFKSRSDYDTAVGRLIDNGEIYYLLLEIDPFSVRIENDSLSYTTSDDERVLTLILNKKVT